jgi:DNA-binding CsgD family transcriptional regulator
VGSEDEIAEAYRAGATTTELAERYGCSHESIRAVLQEQGVAARARGPRSPLDGREDEVVAAYEAGGTVRDLAERFGANVRTIRKVLTDRGVAMRARGRRSAGGP